MSFSYPLKSIKFAISIWALLIMFMAPSQALAVGEEDPDILPELNELAHQEVTSRLTSYGNDLMGDSVDPSTGTLVFSQTDVSLPGNFGLEVAVRRKLTGIDLQAESASFFANWTMDVPRISMLITKHANKMDFGPANTWPNRCTDHTFPGEAFEGNFQADEYWDGMDISIPGYGTQKVLDTPVSNSNIWGNNPVPNKSTTGHFLFSWRSFTRHSYEKPYESESP